MQAVISKHKESMTLLWLITAEVAKFEDYQLHDNQRACAHVYKQTNGVVTALLWPASMQLAAEQSASIPALTPTAQCDCSAKGD